jgi:hypothetical protein
MERQNAKRRISRRVVDIHEKVETRIKGNWVQQTSVGLLQCIYLEEVGNDNGEVGYYQHIHIVNTPICLRLNLKEVEFECGRLNDKQKCPRYSQ